MHDTEVTHPSQALGDVQRTALVAPRHVPGPPGAVDQARSLASPGRGGDGDLMRLGPEVEAAEGCERHRVQEEEGLHRGIR